MKEGTLKPKLLDLFCCQGGAGMGYHRAGFKVIGVDIEPQPRYPFDFYRANAISLLKTLKAGGSFSTGSSSPLYTLDDFAAIHASPPCQAHTNAQKIMGNEHPELIDPTRELLIELGLPYVIENVPGAPLRNPFELCGSMFGLGTYRHRLFETNFYVVAPDHNTHTSRTTKMGRKPVDGEMMHVVGNFSGVAKARVAMGIDWMTRDGLSESIPPAYTEHIGSYLMAEVRNRRELAA